MFSSRETEPLIQDEDEVALRTYAGPKIVNNDDDDDLYDAPYRAKALPSVAQSLISYVALFALFVGLAAIAYGVEQHYPPAEVTTFTGKDIPALSESLLLQYTQDLVDIAMADVGQVVDNLVVIPGRIAMTNKVDLTVQYLEEKINEINSRLPATRQYEIDVTAQTGTAVDEGLFISYEGVTNVLARLTGSLGSGAPALLISAHFDSIPYSPGASDNAAAVSACLGLMETVASATTYPEGFPYTIIFLFDDAEESGLMGAHAFLDYHPWASAVKAFINMDSAGGWRVPILSQVSLTNAWLGRVYKAGAPYPYASVVVQDIFNILPSGTNWEVAQDKIASYDLDMLYNGYTYHTVHDSLDDYEDGTLQAIALNVLGLMEEMRYTPEFVLSMPDKEQSYPVFYDFLASGFVSYTDVEARGTYMTLAVICAVIFALFLVVHFRDHKFDENREWLNLAVVFVISLVGIVVTVGVMFVMSIVCGILLQPAGSPWFAQPLSGVFAFSSWILFAITGMTTVTAFAMSKIRIAMPTRLFQLDMVMFFCINAVHVLVMVGLLFAGFGSAYIPFFWVLFSIPAAILFFIASRTRSPKAKSILSGLGYLLWTIIPMLLALNVTYRFVIGFTPMLGRFGPDAPIGAMYGLFFAIFAIFIVLPLIPLIYRIHHGLVATILMAVVVVLATLITAFAHSPYSAENPRRVDVVHMYNAVTGVTEIALGAPNPGALDDVVAGMSYTKWYPCDAPTYGYKFRPESLCHGVDALPITMPTIEVTSSTREGDIWTLDVEFETPGSQVVAIKFSGGELVSWSLSPTVPTNTEANDYLGLEKGQYGFFRRTKSESNLPLTLQFNSTEPVHFEIWTSYHAVTQVQAEIISQLPEWATVWSKSNNPGPVLVYQTLDVASP